MLKRAFDILFASTLLAASLPVLCIAAILIKLDSEGPVVFCQSRMGRRFTRFQLFKLRSMNLHGSGPAYTLGADPRITRIGRWLRRYKIDELPQLWNVLRGEMSVVGPRPVIPDLALEFDWAYARLLTVRPGLTDPASLKYCNETEILQSAPDAYRYFKTVVTPDKIRISLAYLRGASLWSDLAVTIKTALALISPALRQRFGAEISSRKIPDPRLLNFPASPPACGSRPLRADAPAVAPLDVSAGVIEARGMISSGPNRDTISF